MKIKSRSVIGCCAVAIGALAVSPLHAAVTHRYSFTTNANDSVGSANGTLNGVATVSGGQLQLNNPNFSAGVATNPNDGYASLPASIMPASGGATIEEWFTAQGSGFFTESYTFTNGVGGGFQPSGAGGQYLIHTISAPQPATPPGGANTGGNHIEETLNGFSLGQQIDAFGTTPGMGFAGGGYLDNGDSCMSATVINPDGILDYYLYDITTGTGGLQQIIYGSPLSSFAFTSAYLGRSPFDVDNIMSGTIDEFRIFNDPQSPTAVAANFAAGPNDANIVIGVPEPVSFSFLGFGAFGLLMRRPSRRTAR